MSYRTKQFLNNVLVGSVILIASGSAHAATYQWVGPDNGAWNNAANWSPAAVPGVADSVVIPGKKKVAVPVDVVVANLTVGPGAEIKNGGKVKVSGKTNSAGLFTGLGTLEIPAGATAIYDVNASSSLATSSGTSTPVVFAPITNNGSIITKVAQGCHVDFASVQNSGSTQITSDGTVTFKDIKNTKSLDINATGTLTLAKIENATGASVSIAATVPGTPPLQGTPVTAVEAPLAKGKKTRGKGPDNSDPSVVHLNDVINHPGGKVKLLGVKGGRLFDGKSINNQGDMQISGAQTLLEADVTNAAGATLTLDSDAMLFPSDASAPKLNNAGTIIKAAGSDATLNVEWTNSGQVVVENGTLHVRVPAGKGCKQTGGTTTLEEGVLSVEDPTGLLPSGTFEVTGGVVNGIGTIQGNVINSGGHFKPGHSPGTITINGNFTQTAGGVLDMEVGGDTPGTGYDQILVNGTAYLNGTLNMVRWGNFMPHGGDVYTMFTYYAKVGNFTKFVDTTPVAGITYDTTLTPTDYEINCYSSGPVDSTPPVVSISSPVDGRGAPSVPSASGKASDVAGTVAKVTCRLYRYQNPVTGVAGAYWNGGTAWTPTATVANEELAKGTTAWTIAFPALVPGRYSLWATASDAAGNAAVSSPVAFWVDPNAPAVLTVDTPANGATVTAFTALGGAVSDASDGSGVISVQGQIRRAADGLYWNGTGWSSNVFFFATTLSGARWVRTTNLPTGANLAAGKYIVNAIATDRAGNTKTVTSSFVLVAPSALPKSSVSVG